MNNTQIAELLRNVAASYQYKDPIKYKFQIIAYNRAADSIEHATSELKDLWDDGKLDDVPSIGVSIAKHLDELFRTGKSKHFEDLMKDIPKEAFILMALPKIGLKTALRLIAQGKPDEVKRLLKDAEKLKAKNKRLLLPYAENLALEVIEWIKKSEYVENVDVLGSLRRRSATVGDIDILAAPKNSKTQKIHTKGGYFNSKLIEHFTKYPKAQKIIEAGDTTASLLLPNNVQVDLLVMDSEAYGNALQHFTGSKFHNIALREHAKKLGYSLNEYGVKKANSGQRIANRFKTEEELYEFLGLRYIEPELREDAGEIESSLNNSLPNLVKLEDIKADLQIHSNFDIETSHDLGVSTMEEIIEKASQLGYEYIAFTEHNPSKKGHTNQQKINLIKQKSEAIEQLNYSRESNSEKRIPKVFNSLEIDINKDGSLPLPDKAFDFLDFTLVSIHGVFDLSRFDQTKRVINALSYPKVKIFAHPTARKINEREGVELDWEKIFDFCLKNNKWIEINADPMRLDLPDTLVRDAVKLGVKLTLGTDTHEVSMMNNMKYGVDVARRGWAEKKNIINTRSLKEFEEMLQ